MKKKLLSIMVLLSIMLCVNAQDNNNDKSEEQGSNASSPRPLPQVIEDLIENMVYVEGGTFTMGDNNPGLNGDPLEREKPEHQVTLSPYFICRYEVTQEVWDAVMGVNFTRVRASKLPVDNVCWDDCQEFVLKLVLMTGINFRLPTEAEWEFAARGGNKSRHTKYSGSNDIDSVGWCRFNSGNILHPVGQKMPNELGLYDMTGNVGEWCYDYYGRYDGSAQINPRGVANGAENVVRGGNCFQILEVCHIAFRYGEIPAQRSPGIGLRLAATPFEVKP
ncbi:MAG: SUMF1/EgtB/PvdO family nonheme iron enzyme [Prevotella sp.]|nr:SUMF1/EgtB/PvdO family nonheme iron enzyme [Prevotella sp.]